MIFDPSVVKEFRFISCSFDDATGKARFVYAFDEDTIFTEELIFPGADRGLSPDKKIALDLCLRHLHLMLGISYYKAAVPSRILVETGDLDEETARFFEKIYVRGLGEFAYRNGLDLADRIRFPFASGVRPEPSPVALSRRTAVPVGGGKDSIVSIEALRRGEEPMVLFSLGEFEAISRVVKVANLPFIQVKRRLSPHLPVLNGRGALNGHVPISAIIAFLLPVCALLYGFDAAALSNERSASAGNLEYKGLEVNHQYSKGLEFEEDASRFFRGHLLRNFHYFSLLRPLSELEIARLFSACTAFHPVFTSCNAAFRLDAEKRIGRWCCACPKCRSTFLLLAPFLEKGQLLSIFGRNLLDEEGQVAGFDELLGLKGTKPFECVGEPGEYMTALLMIMGRREWHNDAVIRRFRLHGPVPEGGIDGLKQKNFSFSDRHILPPRYEALLRAYSGF